MDTPYVETPLALDEAVSRIVELFQPVQIILFGSWARGEARAGSDVDLLVVLPDSGEKRQSIIDIMRALSDLPISKDIVVTSPAEIAERGHLVGTILRPALREGRVVYERS